MQNSVRAIVHDGKIEPLEPIRFPEGSQLVILCMDENDDSFWTQASAGSLHAVWGNSEDDVYAELLKK